MGTLPLCCQVAIPSGVDDRLLAGGTAVGFKGGARGENPRFGNRISGGLEDADRGPSSELPVLVLDAALATLFNGEEISHA